MRYAIFSDIHANLEALEAVLAKIDELAQEKPIEQIWFLGDLVGYGPDPNECIVKLHERTDVIIAGNHDWAAVGKIDLEDFSAAARISAEWTAKQLTAEHRTFLTNLPERLEIGECTLVHGSPYGPLWEYLTSEMLAERSFQYFSTRFCLVGHTHVPVIFQQPDTFSNTPTLPLQSDEPTQTLQKANGLEHHVDEDDIETEEMVAVQTSLQQSTLSAAANGTVDSAFKEPESINQVEDDEVESKSVEKKQMQSSDVEPIHQVDMTDLEIHPENPSSGLKELEQEEIPSGEYAKPQAKHADLADAHSALPEQTANSSEEPVHDTLAAGNAKHESLSDDDNAALKEVDDNTSIEAQHSEKIDQDTPEQLIIATDDDFEQDEYETKDLEGAEGQDSIGSHDEDQASLDIILEPVIADSDDQLNGEIEELLTLLGLSQSMIKVTNEMLTPPEGPWKAEDGYRAIINPGGVGQPRDGDPRAAFMIYDTEQGFEFYRVPYAFEKTQEKIIEAGLPHYLAVRLEYGR